MAAPGGPVLAFDTSGPYAAVALVQDTATLADVTEPMERGQADRLFPIIEGVLAAHRITLADLRGVAVGVGPGSFTGVRISVALARGLALSLEVPAVGVSLFEVVAHSHGSDAVLASLPGPRDSAYVQLLNQGRPASPAYQIDPAAKPQGLPLPSSFCVVGWEAERIGRQFGAGWVAAEPVDVSARIAMIGERRLAQDNDSRDPPVPLYVRPPDAAPPRQAPIRHLDRPDP